MHGALNLETTRFGVTIAPEFQLDADTVGESDCIQNSVVNYMLFHSDYTRRCELE